MQALTLSMWMTWGFTGILLFGYFTDQGNEYYVYSFAILAAIMIVGFLANICDWCEWNNQELKKTNELLREINERSKKQRPGQREVEEDFNSLIKESLNSKSPK